MTAKRQAEDRRSLAQKVTVTPADVDRILELKAKGEAVASIRRALGVNGPGIRKIYQIIAEAKAMHAPPQPKTSPKKPEQVQRQICLPSGEALDGWWFGAETMFVTRLGFGSVDCSRIPVSVSCVPSRTQTIRSTVSRRPDAEIHRSFADAFASLASRSNRDERSGDAQGESAQPE